MKRSKYVQLSLAASVAMAISGCGPTEKTYDLQKKYNFQSVQQCADEKLPVDVCSDAYMTAMAELWDIALAEAIKRAPTLPKDHLMVVCLSGRGDKDMQTVMSHMAAQEKQA